ncbi:MAG: epoxyqueuosine reductase QueH [Lachnospiraceae bacterium]|nr:epoxyqueuosine reductase QueH [Lachnospiraceae bacterium]
MKRNYQRELEQVIQNQQKQGRIPRLFLHSCCAPCSSYVLEYLSEYFQITVFYYNPNIYPSEEYQKRVEEQKQFICQFSQNVSAERENGRSFYPIHFTEGNFDAEKFYKMAEGLEKEPEGGERCFRCYELRLREAAEYAARLKMDYFTTTLSISPLKNAEKLNEIGERLAKEYGISYLCSDFKKKNGYKRSVELSREYGMYRQDYCGCVFSKQERESQKSHDKSR